MSLAYETLYDQLLHFGWDTRQLMEEAEVERAMLAAGFALLQERHGTLAACDLVGKIVFRVRNGPIYPPNAVRDG